MLKQEMTKKVQDDFSQLLGSLLPDVKAKLVREANKEAQLLLKKEFHGNGKIRQDIQGCVCVFVWVCVCVMKTIMKTAIPFHCPRFHALLKIGFFCLHCCTVCTPTQCDVIRPSSAEPDPIRPNST